MTNEGLLSARSTSFFVPDVVITRAEAINALYVLADAYLPRESIDSTGFTDVPVTHTYASAITWAKQRGIMLGTSETESIFSPNTGMNREQFCVLVYRFFTANELSMTSIYTANITPNIPDQSSISDWALTAVRTLYMWADQRLQRRKFQSGQQYVARRSLCSVFQNSEFSRGGQLMV